MSSSLFTVCVLFCRCTLAPPPPPPPSCVHVEVIVNKATVSELKVTRQSSCILFFLGRLFLWRTVFFTLCACPSGGNGVVGQGELLINLNSHPHDQYSTVMVKQVTHPPSCFQRRKERFERVPQTLKNEALNQLGQFFTTGHKQRHCFRIRVLRRFPGDEEGLYLLSSWLPPQSLSLLVAEQLL